MRVLAGVNEWHGHGWISVWWLCVQHCAPVLLLCFSPVVLITFPVSCSPSKFEDLESLVAATQTLAVGPSSRQSLRLTVGLCSCVTR
jgi:hypothetical protein